jgi:F0F1-type ATP synthase membrane subunit b/b'
VEGLESLGIGFLNLVLFVGIVAFFAREPLRGFFKQRAQDISSLIERADKALREAKESLNLWEKRHSGLQAEALEILEHSRNRARRDGEALLVRSKERGARVLEEARLRMDFREKEAIEAKRLEFLILLTEELKEMFRTKLTDDERRALIEKAIQRLGSISQVEKEA